MSSLATEGKQMNAETKITAEEMVESLNGYDARLIRKHFDAEWTTLAEQSPINFNYALIFIQKKREGMDDLAALDSSLSMPLSEVKDYFLVEEEPMPEDPSTDSGKED